MTGQTRREMLRASVAGVAAAAGVGGLLTGGDVAGAVIAPVPAPIREPERRLWRLEYLEGARLFDDVEFWSHINGPYAAMRAGAVRGDCREMWLTRAADGRPGAILKVDVGGAVSAARVTEVPDETPLWMRAGGQHSSVNLPAREWAAVADDFWRRSLQLPAREWAALGYGRWPLSESAGD